MGRGNPQHNQSQYPALYVLCSLIFSEDIKKERKKERKKGRKEGMKKEREEGRKEGRKEQSRPWMKGPRKEKKLRTRLTRTKDGSRLCV